MVTLSRRPAWQCARSREENGILGRHAEYAVTPRSIDQSSSMADQSRQIKLAAAKKKVKLFESSRPGTLRMICHVSRGLVCGYTDLVSLLVVNYLRRCGVVITRRPTTVRWLMPPLSPLRLHYCTPVAGASTRPLLTALTFPDGVASFYFSRCPFSLHPTVFHPTIKQSCFSIRGVSPTLAYVEGKRVVLWDKLTLATLLTNEVNCRSVKNAHCCCVGRSVPCLLLWLLSYDMSELHNHKRANVRTRFSLAGRNDGECFDSWHSASLLPCPAVWCS